MERDQARKISTRQTCDPKMPHVGRHGAAGTSANNGQKWLCVFLGLPHLIFLLGPGVREFAELGPVLKPPILTQHGRKYANQHDVSSSEMRHCRNGVGGSEREVMLVKMLSKVIAHRCPAPSRFGPPGRGRG